MTRAERTFRGAPCERQFARGVSGRSVGFRGITTAGFGYTPPRRHASPDSLLGTRAAEHRRAKGTSSARRDGTDVSHATIVERGSSTDRVLTHEVTTHMTKNESFKRRVRERMEQTGERYGAARRVLLGGLANITQAGPSDPRDCRVIR